MYTVEREVKSRGKVLGTVTAEVFESIDEAIEHLKEDTVLSLVNEQYRTRKMNAKRALLSPSRKTKANRRRIAYNLLTKEEATSVLGDFEALQTLLDSPEVQERVDNYLARQDA